MPETELLSERRQDALVLTLNRPRRRNALTVDLVATLADHIAAAPADGVRAVIITGSAPAFCAGGDLADLSGVAEEGALAVSETIYGRFHRLVRTIGSVPVPVIAAINGPALGAGLDLALVCDLRIAATDAVLASSWIAVGLVPGMGGASYLTRLAGGTRAAELVLTGRRIDAATAYGWGLLNEVVEPETLLDRARELADELAALPGPALARSKAALRRSLDAGMESELAALGAVQGTLLTSEDFVQRSAPFRR
ncbi:MAG TPA: enoyl-CoA hydratase-related protein [Actinoallomurus sp.]|jgi:2-(1,2-epoxy-1,2-dihydrophenyl)acetyl-CoA isomerase